MLDNIDKIITSEKLRFKRATCMLRYIKVARNGFQYFFSTASLINHINATV